MDDDTRCTCSFMTVSRDRTWRSLCRNIQMYTHTNDHSSYINNDGKVQSYLGYQCHQ